MPYELLCNGSLVGVYPTNDDAMRAAQDMGMLCPARDEEGGYPYAVLGTGHTLRLKTDA